MSYANCTITYNKKDVSTPALKKFFKSLEKHYVTVGIHRAEGAKVINVHKGKTFKMIQNACIQEFGNVQHVLFDRRFKSPYTGKWFFIKEGTDLRIPPRVFIRIFTERSLQKELTGNLKKIIQQNVYKNPEYVYKQIGDYARLKMKERFLTNQIKPENAPMTVAYKGSDDPLYITGRMANSIKSEVH